MVTTSDDPRRTDVPSLVEHGDADRMLPILATVGPHLHAAVEDRGGPVIEGADRAAAVLESRELTEKLSPELVASFGSASQVGGGA